MGLEVDQSHVVVWDESSQMLSITREPVAVDGVDAALERRLRAIAHVRMTAAERMRHADLRHAELDRWQHELDEQRRQLAALYQDLERRTVEINRRQADLEMQHEALAIQKRQVVRREAEFIQAEALRDDDRSGVVDPDEPIHRIEQEAAARRAAERLRLADLRHEQLAQWQDRLEGQHHILAQAHRQLAEQRRQLELWRAEVETRHAAAGEEAAGTDDLRWRIGVLQRRIDALTPQSSAARKARPIRRRRPSPAAARTRLLRPRRRRP